MNAMKRIAMPALAALVLAACGGRGDGPVEQARAEPALVIIGAAAIGAATYRMGKGPPGQLLYLTLPSTPDVSVVRKIDLRAGDKVEVQVSEDAEAAKGRRLVARFTNETSGETWTERYANSRIGRETLEARLQWMEEKKAVVRMERTEG